jgi:hydroxymethylpyrimidine pyrophosphatase-like HAD family hydrolase
MIRLLALDIDGTLLDSTGQIPPANRDAIVRAIDAGVEVALATGRRYDFARPIFDLLPEPLTLILSNGAVVKTHRGETMMRRLLPREIARQVLEAVPEHRREAAVTFDRPREGQIVYQSIDWDHPQHHRFFAANRPYLAEMNPLEDCLTEDPVQVMFAGACAEMRELFNELRAGAHPTGRPARKGGASAGARKAAALVDDGRDHRYSVALTEYGFRDFSLVDVLQAGCSKGTALKNWARERGYARDEVMAVGDNLNDLEMLEFAGCPVVMGNGIRDLKARGWAQTATNDEAGVARAVETFILRGAS